MDQARKPGLGLRQPHQVPLGRVRGGELLLPCFNDVKMTQMVSEYTTGIVSEELQ